MNAWRLLPGEVREAYWLYRRGMGYKQLAAKYGCCIETLVSAFNEFGLPLVGPGGIETRRKRPRWEASDRYTLYIDVLMGR